MAKNFAQLRAKMSPAAREASATEHRRLVEEMSLVQLRRARDLTQAKLAEELHMGQDDVSKLERRTDMYVSTLASYLQAVGADLEIRALFPDGCRRLTLSSGCGRCHAWQPFQRRVLELSWRSHIGHRQQLLHRFIDSVQEPKRYIGRILLDQVPPKLPDDVVARSGANDWRHGFFRALCFAAMSRASALRSFQKPGVIGMSSPPANPSRSRASSRASSSSLLGIAQQRAEILADIPVALGGQLAVDECLEGFWQGDGDGGHGDFLLSVSSPNHAA